MKIIIIFIISNKKSPWNYISINMPKAACRLNFQIVLDSVPNTFCTLFSWYFLITLPN